MDSSTFWFSFMKGSMFLSFGGGVTETGKKSHFDGSDCLYFSSSTESVRAARSKKNRARKSRSQNKQQDSRRAREQDFFILKRNHQNIHQNRNAKNKIFHSFILWQCDFFARGQKHGKVRGGEASSRVSKAPRFCNAQKTHPRGLARMGCKALPKQNFSS